MRRPTIGRLLFPVIVCVLAAWPVDVRAQSPSTLVYPPNGAIDVDLSQPFQWTSVSSAQAYYLYVGTTIGAKDLINTGEIAQTSYGGPTLPGGRVLYARLWTKIANAWSYTDTSFSGIPLAIVTFPANGATNVDLSLPIQWTAVPTAQAYYLYLGTTPGTKDLTNTGVIGQTSWLASSVYGPQTVYARIWTQLNGVWRYNDSSFATAPTLPTFTYPASASAPVDVSRAWTWSSVPNAQAYYLFVGTSVGARDLVDTGEIQQTSFSPGNLGVGVVYARLWVKLVGRWYYRDSPFNVPERASITYPGNGAMNVDVSLPLRWTAVPAAQAYYLYVGSALGGKDFVDSGETLQTSWSIRSLPPERRLYARLWTKFGAFWAYTDCSFTTSALAATLTYPASGEVNVDPNRPFTWTSIQGAQAYYLYVGTAVGTNDLVNTGEIQPTSYQSNVAWDRRVEGRAAWKLADDPTSVAGFALILDGGRIDLGQPFPALCLSPPPDPMWCYTVPLPPRMWGNHVIQVSAYNGAGEATSPEVTFTDMSQLAYARLWTKVAGVWRYTDSSFSSKDLGAEFVYPAFGAMNVDVTKPFTWTPVAGADAYSLTIGTASGMSDLLNLPNLSGTSYLATALANLPAGFTVFARLGTLVHGMWRYKETAFSVMPLAVLTYPYNRATLVATSIALSWTPAETAQAYYVYIGTAPGLKNIVNSLELQVPSYRVRDLPSMTTLYVRLWTKTNGIWRYVDSVFDTM